MQRMAPGMRRRLERNCQGRLSGAQLLAVMTQPLTAPLVLLAPLVVILGPRMLVSLRTFGLVALLVILLLLVPALLRARRYARAPLQFAELTTDSSPLGRLFFWRPLVMRAADGEALRFQVRLAPLPGPGHGKGSLVYYLQDGQQRVLLSHLPADHPDARLYRPTENFQRRAGQRS